MTGSEWFALLLTWTCYGTWLPGDRRGYVSNTFQSDGSYQPKVNALGAPCSPGSPQTARRARALQSGHTVFLSRQLARFAAEGLIEAAHKRSWRILRGAVMANHVHVVITDCPDDAREVRRALKGSSQAWLSRQSSEVRRWWTAGGSDRYLHDERAVRAAIRYVGAQHGRLAEILDGELLGEEPLR